MEAKPIEAAPFIKRLYEVVSDPATKNYISWSDTNDSIVIWKPDHLTDEIFSQFKQFKHTTNIQSLIRQLKDYGFHQIPRQNEKELEYKHSCFRKDNTQLQRIHRKPAPEENTNNGHSDPKETNNSNNNKNTESTFSKEVLTTLQQIQNELTKIRQENVNIKQELNFVKRNVDLMMNSQLLRNWQERNSENPEELPSPKRYMQVVVDVNESDSSHSPRLQLKPDAKKKRGRPKKAQVSVKSTRTPAKKPVSSSQESSPYKKVYNAPKRRSPSPEEQSRSPSPSSKPSSRESSPTPKTNATESSDEDETPRIKEFQTPPITEVKRKRGRPPGSKNKSSEKPAKKPSSKPTPTPKSQEKEGSTESPEKRKRGRPPKKKPKPAEPERIIVDSD